MVDSEPRWHPKITPYRLTVLATTISLGTAKAVSAQMGSTFIPITLEWVSGTVVFLMLFIVSPYDSQEDAPPYLSWLFEPDCMDLIWHLLAVTFSVSRPNYLSEERIFTQAFRKTDPPVTSYRILVSSSVVAFGVTKATFGYLGAITAATWTDWMLGVVATSIFYCLGLYECNSLNLWPSFFSNDQRHRLMPTVIHTTKYTAGIAFSVTWILFWTHMLQRAWLDVSFTPLTGNPDAHRSFLEQVSEIASKCLFIELNFLIIALGIVCLSRVLYFVAISEGFKVLASPFRGVRARIFGGGLPLFSSEDDGSIPLLAGIPNRYIERTTTIFRVCIHITLHLCALAACLPVAVVVSGVVGAHYDTLKFVDNFFAKVYSGFLGIDMVAMAAFLWFAHFLIVVSMISPLFKYHDSRLFRSSLISP